VNDQEREREKQRQISLSYSFMLLLLIDQVRDSADSTTETVFFFLNSCILCNIEGMPD